MTVMAITIFLSFIILNLLSLDHEHHYEIGVASTLEFIDKLTKLEQKATPTRRP